MERVIDDNFGSYYTRLLHPGDMTSVSLGLYIYHLDYDVSKRVLGTTGYMYMFWNDSRLAWNPDMYDNVRYIRLPSWRVWKPDILPYNKIGELETEYVNVHVSYRGYLLWVPPFTMHTPCKRRENTRRTVDCPIKLGSWSYNNNEIKLRKADSDSIWLEDDIWVNYPPYTVTNSSAEIVGEQYSSDMGEFAEFIATITLGSL